MGTALLLVQSSDGQALEIIEALPSSSELAPKNEFFREQNTARHVRSEDSSSRRDGPGTLWMAY
jgi:hypothetical protein